MSKFFQNNNFELNKVPGYECLDKKSEERTLKSYNEDFFSSLNSMKDSLVPIDRNQKLSIGAEINHNSSVSSMTGQILSSYEDLVKSNIELFRQRYALRQEIKELRAEIEKIDRDIIVIYKPEIDKFRKLTQAFLCEQKTENFRLLKEIKQLETEKLEIEEELAHEVEKLSLVEKSVGTRRPMSQFTK